MMIVTIWRRDWLVFAETEVAATAAATATVASSCNAADQEQRLKRHESVTIFDDRDAS